MLESATRSAVDSAPVDAAAVAILARAPFHKFLGLRLLQFGDGSAEILMPFREEVISNPDIPYIHGGVIASLLDIAGDFAVVSQLGRGVPTIDMRVDYLRTAGRENLLAVARVIKLGRTLATADAEVRREDGKTIALGRILYSTAMRAPAAPADAALT
jgi:uncharacterized protein (TIGR00369 family)